MRQSCGEGNKQLVATDVKMVLSKSMQEVKSIVPCTHEQAGTRILLHAAHAFRNSHRKVLIRTRHTNVVVLACSVSQEIFYSDKLWVATGTNKNLAILGNPKNSSVLDHPMFNALPGCDTASSERWKHMQHGMGPPALTDALFTIPSGSKYIPEEMLHTIVW